MDHNSATVFWATIFLSFLFLAIFEQKWLYSWKRSYYKKGISVFKKSFAYVGNPINEIDVNILSNEFEDIKVLPFAFYALSSDEIVFHQKQFKSSYANYVTVMHGIIQVDHLNQRVVMTGNADFTPIWLFIIFAGLSWLGTVPIVIILGLLAFLIWSYWVQRRLFSRIFERIQEGYTVLS